MTTFPFTSAGRYLAAGGVFFLWTISALAEPVRIKGPASLTKALSELTAVFRDAGVEIRVEATSGAAGAIAALGSKEADVVVLSRALTAQEKSRFPTRRFFELAVAAQAYVPGVSKNVWESGVRTITKEQMQKLFEGKAGKWAELGGGDSDIKYFSAETENPAFDLLATWLYQDPRRAPASTAEIIRGGGRAVRDTLEFTSNSIALVPPALANGKDLFALGIADPAGKVIQAEEASLLDRSYPLSRPVFLIFGDRPSGAVREFLDLIRSPAGREILIKGDLTPVSIKDL